MLVDFDGMETTELKNFRGGEKTTRANMFTDENNKIMRGVLESGASIGLHTHDTSSEIIYILKGRGRVLYNGESETLSEGSCHYCPIGGTHSLINDSDSDLVFFAVVPQHNGAFDSKQLTDSAV